MVSLKTTRFSTRSLAEEGVALRVKRRPWNKYEIRYQISPPYGWRYCIYWVPQTMHCFECGRMFTQIRGSQYACCRHCLGLMKGRKRDHRRFYEGKGEYNRLYAIEWRKRMKKGGKCARCGKNNDRQDKSTCSECSIVVCANHR